MSKGLERRSEHYSYPQISYYDHPIEVLLWHGVRVEYSRWDSGFRLISVDGVPSHRLSNSEFSFFLNIVSNC